MSTGCPKYRFITSGSCNNDFVVFEDFDIVFCENNYAINVAEFSGRDERSGGDTIQNVALLNLLG